MAAAPGSDAAGPRRLVTRGGRRARHSIQACALLARNRAKGDHETGLVWMDEALVREYVARAPGSFQMHARTPAHEITIGGPSINFIPVADPPNASDLDHGRRPGTFEDQQNLIRLNQALGAKQLSGAASVETLNLPAGSRHRSSIGTARKPYATMSHGESWQSKGEFVSKNRTAGSDSTAYISAKRTPTMMLDDTTGQIDMRALRAYRLGRLQAELQKHDYGGALLFDPINLRYATGSRNMTVWLLHNPGRYCLVPAEGKVVLFEYGNANCRQLAAGLETIGEIRRAIGCQYFYAGESMEGACKAFADELADALRSTAKGNTRLAVDRIDPAPARALERLGVELFDGQEPCEQARAIKGPEEIACMAVATAACDAGMARMREALRPGITENQLWAELHHANIALGGEWIETRLLSSGGRTNPWFQESSDRVIRPGDLVSFDTDLIGPYGYCADLSRTFFCGPGKPNGEQRSLYGVAMEQIQHNLELLKPGVSFDELRENAWKVPGRFEAQKYSSVYHGVGLCDEWPAISYGGVGRISQRGTVLPGMVLCVESYIGEVGGAEGVKLEEQILITDSGPQILSTFPFEETLLG